MSAITSLFDQAQLAEAAYANFWDSELNVLITNPEDVKTALIAQGFSATQTTEFVKHWRVVDQYNNSQKSMGSDSIDLSIWQTKLRTSNNTH